MILTGTGVAVAALATVPLAHRKMRQLRAAKALVINSPAGVAEERFVKIGGLEQWISIRGEDRGNPVLLIVHGGPGASYEMFAPIMRAWEKEFTLVNWDQPGAGRTFARHGKDGTGQITVDRLVSDGLQVAEHVRTRLGKRQLVLVGSSFGSLIALRMAKLRPELFSAYVGTDQNTGMADAEETGYQETIARLRALGRKKGVAALEKMGPDSSRWSAKDWTVNAKWTMASDPATDPVRKLLGPSMWFAPGISLRGMRQAMAGMELTNEQLYKEFPTVGAAELGTTYEMPFYVFQGEGDVLTPPSLAAEFFATVEAPVKRMALIKGVGHFAMFTQPGQFLQLLLDSGVGR